MIRRRFALWASRHVWNPRWGGRWYGITGESRTWVFNAVLKDVYLPMVFRQVWGKRPLRLPGAL